MNRTIILEYLTVIVTGMGKACMEHNSLIA